MTFSISQYSLTSHIAIAFSSGLFDVFFSTGVICWACSVTINGSGMGRYNAGDGKGFVIDFLWSIKYSMLTPISPLYSCGLHHWLSQYSTWHLKLFQHWFPQYVAWVLCFVFEIVGMWSESVYVHTLRSPGHIS